MAMSLLNSLTSVGEKFAGTPAQRRSIFLTNVASLLLSAIGLSLFIVYYMWYGWNFVTYTIPFIAVLSLSPLLFNHYNMSTIGKLWVSLFIPVAAMALSIYSKSLYYESQEELDYFTFRFVILSSCVFPPLFFSTKEKKLLVATALVILTILMLHDPLHTFFGVPYQAMNLKESNYAFTNVVVFMVYILMAGSVIFMKWISETNEDRAHILIGELNNTNQKLQEQNFEIESQNKEILHQAENLNISRRKLSDAYKIIEEQRNLLYAQNKSLSSELIGKNKELTETNTELIKHNNELRQFSYTVSHNLRGPVASLIGLLRLFDSRELNRENGEIFSHIENSTHRLDNIIKDLSKIIDIRNEIFQIRQQIDLEVELYEILQDLHREIVGNRITIVRQLDSAKIIYSVRPMVHSILYNLIINSIKYRSGERPAVIKVTSYEDDNFYELQVTDNGLGIDLSRERDNLFKLYKRFHHHIEGKGLGLYLVKLQAEALGGNVTIESEVNKFTTFTVKLRKPENAERQVLYKDDRADIFFDATLNCIGTLWSKPSYQHYKDVVKKLLDFIKVYNTPNYITDLINESWNKNPESDALFSTIIPEAARSGLLRVAVISDPYVSQQIESIVKTSLAPHQVKLEFFLNMNQCVNWIQHENKNTSVNVVE